MTESRPEHRPLLCDEYSDEELQLHEISPKFHRRFRHSFTTGRARTHAIGAAAIITRWPDHLSALLTYWWIGLGMIAVTVFVIYNSIAAIALLPPANHNKALKLLSPKFKTYNETHDNSSAPNVYMHVFVTSYDEFKIDNYLRYIDTMAKKYIHFKYNLIVISNDMVKDVGHDLDEEQNNEMALNSLWTYNKTTSKRKQYENFFIKFITVTKYMDDSPLKKYWRLLPYQFLGFLARLIAVWDKGGVSFNPLILTPNTPNPNYLEKLYDILGNVQSKNKLISSRKRKSKMPKKNLNNIRDIINNLENQDRDDTNFPDNLSEAENVPLVAIIPSEVNQHFFNSASNITKQKSVFLYNNSPDSENSKITISPSTHKSTNRTVKIISTKENIVPNFFDFLFNMNIKNSTSLTQNLENSTTSGILPVYDNLKHDTQAKAVISNNTKKSPIRNISHVKKKTKFIKKSFGENENSKLIIDFKGNLIATETACHAFIGTVFSNVLHHNDEESLTDFIITELSLFCKGNLSTCDGVEVILL